MPNRLWQGQRDFDGEVTGSSSRYGEFIRKRALMATARRIEKDPVKTAAPKTKLMGALADWFRSK